MPTPMSCQAISLLFQKHGSKLRDVTLIAPRYLLVSVTDRQRAAYYLLTYRENDRCKNCSSKYGALLAVFG